MVKRFIYLANDILPHCGLSPLKSAMKLLWLTAGKRAFNQRKVLLQRMSASVQIVLIDNVEPAARKWENAIWKKCIITRRTDKDLDRKNINL